jgi:hypothetical protein
MTRKLDPSLLTHIVLFVFIILGACKNTGNRTAQSNVVLDAVVEPRLGPDYLTEFNVDRRYVLCQQKRSENDHARRLFKYVVVRVNDRKILNEGAFVMGYVKWIDSAHIEVATTLDDNQKTDVKRIAIDSEL